MFLITLVWFAGTAGQSDIASVFCDPVSRIPSQDEAVYGREAIEMSQTGNLLTPAYLGRYVLNKPPLLQILTAGSVRVFGVSAWALRLPSAIAAALIAALIFFWAWREHSFFAAAAAVILLCSSHLFYVFAQFCMTDMLLTLWLTLAMFVLARDPELRYSSSFWTFSLASSAAILTKAAAGCFPLLALLIYAALAQPGARPRTKRILGVFGATALIALPWHLYQLIVHTRWFIDEYLLTAHFQVGFAAPPQYSNENHILFYARRMFLMDPVLTVLVGISLIPLIRNWRARRITVAWSAAALISLLVFRYRSAYYLLPLIPVFALIAVESFRLLQYRARVATLGLVALCCTIKAASPSPTWGIPFNRPSENSAAPALERYCDLHRGNGLIVIDPKDEFYASILPLAQLRYVLLQPEPPSPPIDYSWLGIWMPAAQFANLERWLPLYGQRLRTFKMNSDQAIGTVIWAPAATEIESIVRAHPESDFSVPMRFAGQFDPKSHTVVPGGAGRVFLLSRTATAYSPSRGCHL